MTARCLPTGFFYGGLVIGPPPNPFVADTPPRTKRLARFSANVWTRRAGRELDRSCPPFQATANDSRSPRRIARPQNRKVAQGSVSPLSAPSFVGHFSPSLSPLSCARFIRARSTASRSNMRRRPTFNDGIRPSRASRLSQARGKPVITASRSGRMNFVSSFMPESYRLRFPTQRYSSQNRLPNRLSVNEAFKKCLQWGFSFETIQWPNPSFPHSTRSDGLFSYYGFRQG